MKAKPFYLYHIVDAQGQIKTSAVMYYPTLMAGMTPTDEDIRKAILESALMANGEYDWPDHGDPDKGLAVELFGPFFPGEPAKSMTQAEYNAIPPEDLP